MRYLEQSGASLILAVVLAAGVASPALAQRGDGCISARVFEEVRLPDRSISPGLIRVCFDREFSPVSFQHEIRVDGEPAALYRSRRRVVRSGDSRPFLRFLRDRSGALWLESYAFPVRGGLAVYQLHQAEAIWITDSRQPENDVLIVHAESPARDRSR